MAAIDNNFVPTYVTPISLVPLSKGIELELYLEALTDARRDDLMKYARSSAACHTALQNHYNASMDTYQSILHARKLYDASSAAIEELREKLDNTRRFAIMEERNLRRDQRRNQHAANVD